MIAGCGLHLVGQLNSLMVDSAMATDPSERIVQLGLLFMEKFLTECESATSATTLFV